MPAPKLYGGKNPPKRFSDRAALTLLLCAVLVLLCPQKGSAFEYGAGRFEFEGGNPDPIVGAWCCNRLPINFYVNTAGVNPAFRSLVDSAAQRWSGPGTQFRLIDAGTTAAGSGIQDFQNVVGWGTLDPGVVARAYVWVDGNACVYEADIRFNSAVNWCDGQCGGHDVWTEALHEFGHWIVLGHEDSVICGGHTVMCSGTACPSFGLVKRSLTPDDRAGLRYAYSCRGVIKDPQRSVLQSVTPDANCNYPAPPAQDICPDTSLCSQPPPPCPSGTIFCDNITIPPSPVLVCPRSEDTSYQVNVIDSCGQPQNFICSANRAMRLDFNLCVDSVQLCGGQENNWPDVCAIPGGLSGQHFFKIAAGMLSCSECSVSLKVNNFFTPTVCTTGIPVKFFDTDSSGCVTPEDYTGGNCNDYNLSGSVNDSDYAIFQHHLHHDCQVQMLGDLDNDTLLTPSDIVLLLNCVFVGSRPDGGCCGLSFSDLSFGELQCDGELTPSDVIVLLTAVYSGNFIGCP